MQSQMQSLQSLVSFSNRYEPVEPEMQGVAIALAGERGPVRLIASSQTASSFSFFTLEASHRACGQERHRQL